MKAVLMSIKPKYCELIAKGKKTVEVRKTKPKLETPFKVYIYCTKGFENNKKHSYKTWARYGKVIGEFVCKKFTYIEAGYDISGDKHLYNTAFIEHRMCIPDIELHEYLYKSRENCGGWAWDISDLVIYDKPKELSEFIRICPEWEKGEITDKCLECEHLYTSPIYHFQECDYEGEVPITRPPQSWCYVEETG